ncbi:UNVERIFIED_CONTAM: hypothetical protein GTU68_003034, partial [Idotea baltica]|nr:hypothetical protein [Idotea baltica]
LKGGFCGGRDTIVEGWTEEVKKWEEIETWPLDDVGQQQTLCLKKSIELLRLRILFNSSTDFFGRIIIYGLEILGEKS